MANLPDFGQFTQTDVENNPKSAEQRNNEYGLKNKNTKVGDNRPLIKKPKGTPNLFQQSHESGNQKMDSQKKNREAI